MAEELLDNELYKLYFYTWIIHKFSLYDIENDKFLIQEGIEVIF
jgi:hypothetical protein